MIERVYKKLRGSAILYDATRVEDPEPELFDPACWRASGEVEGSGDRGRGEALFVRHGDAQWVLRHYRRGGQAAKVSGDRYLWLGAKRTRSVAEWRLLEWLTHHDLPVPHPIAAWYRRRGLLYTADILIERIDPARSLTQALATGGVSEAEWHAIGACIRRFHSEGAYHADLNADNVLFGADNEVVLIDWDRGRLLEPSPVWQQSNLDRLLRSLVKRADTIAEVEFDGSEWEYLVAGYEEQVRA